MGTANSLRIFWTGIMLLLVGSLRAQPGELRFQIFPESGTLGNADHIHQDELGFFWLSSEQGLVRWDGVETVIYAAQYGDSTSLPDNSIYDLAFDQEHNLWIGTDEGLSFFDRRKETFTNYLSHVVVRAVHMDPDGTLWAGSVKGLYRKSASEEEFEHFTHAPNEPGSIGGDNIKKIFRTQEGDLWVGIVGMGISILPKGEDKFVHLRFDPQRKDRLTSSKIRDIMQSRDGTFWIAASQGGLTHLDPRDSTFTHYLPDPDDPGSISSTEAFSLMEDDRGQIWIGTWAGGLNILDRSTGKMRKFRHQPDFPNSLPDDVVTEIVQDKEGLIWVGTFYGNLSFVDPLQRSFVHYRNNPENPNSISRNFIRGILEVSEDELWIGTSNGGLNIYHRDEGRFELIEHDPNDPYSLPSNSTWDIFPGPEGEIWLATAEGLCTPMDEPGKWKIYRHDPDRPFSLSRNTLLSAAFDHTGNIWGGTWKHGLNVIDPETGKAIRFPPGELPDSFPESSIKDLLVDSRGIIWMGTNIGLGRLDLQDTTFSLMTREEDDPSGFPSTNVQTMVEDKEGNLWIATERGLVRMQMDTEEIEVIRDVPELLDLSIFGLGLSPKGKIWLSGSFGLMEWDPKTREIRKFTYQDGLPSNTFGLWANYSGPSGRLYFGGGSGLCEFFPDQIQRDTQSTPTALTGFYLFNRPAKVHPDSILKTSITLAEEVVLDYTDYIFAFSFSSLGNRKSQFSEYKYRLEGFNDNWIETDQKNRRATYTNVPPGTYTFQVKSKNGSGIWDEKGAEIRVVILPPWWQTWWARTLGVLGILGLAYALYWSRVSTLNKQKKLLAMKVKERTAEVVFQNRMLNEQKEALEKEKERSDELLLNILPEAVAEELKAHQRATPTYFPEVSILFTDFVGFTKLSEGLSPQELVAILDRLFSKFDHIVDRYNLEKIKIIGDAYMCAGGLHNEPLGQAKEVVAASLEMVQVIEEFNQAQTTQGLPPWNIRVGIHTGEVVAGVVGEKKFQFDLWGDAVNTASRMESSGEVNRVNISGATYERVKKDFRCTSRGKIPAKNKGLIEMYLVEPHSQVQENPD